MDELRAKPIHQPLQMSLIGWFNRFHPLCIYCRYKADQAFQVGAGKSPVGAYLDIDSIIQVAKRNGTGVFLSRLLYWLRLLWTLLTGRSFPTTNTHDQASTPSTRATGFSRSGRPSPTPAGRTASPSWAPRWSSSTPSATRPRRASWPSRYKTMPACLPARLSAAQRL